MPVTESPTRRCQTIGSAPTCWCRPALKTPAVLCPHGHFRDAKESVVNSDNAGKGERDADNLLSGGKGGCMQAGVRLNHMGLDLTGLCVSDLMAGVNVLAARTDVDARRLGCTATAAAMNFAG